MPLQSKKKGKTKNKNKNKNRNKRQVNNNQNKNKNKKKNNKNKVNRHSSGKSNSNSNSNSNNNNNNNRSNIKNSKLYAMRGVNVIPLDELGSTGQTFPPSKTVAELWEGKEFAVCQTMPHPCTRKDAKLRMESDERKAIENDVRWQQRIRDCRLAAEVHRQVRQSAQHFIQPGLTMVEICEFIERTSSQLVAYQAGKPEAAGWGFPTGCSLNEVAAHYTPNTGDPLRLRMRDLCKIDFGVQINGHIVDCAFSMSFDPMHDELMAAVKAATNRGV
jgi:methionyl aminopeptidase